MLQVRIHGPDDVRLDEVPDPVAGPRDVIVRVAACGLCGTDLKYIGLGGIAGPGPEPMALGHEVSGTVEVVGGEVPGAAEGGVAVGDRVVILPGDDEVGRIGNGIPEGGLAPLLAVREAARGGRLFRVPDSLPLDLAALNEPIGVGAHAVDRTGAEPGDKVAIFGAGPIGLTALAVLLDRGIDDVVVVDLSAARLELAEQLGARAVISAGDGDPWVEISSLHGSEPHLLGSVVGTDVFVEATGAGSVITAMVQHAKKRACLSIVGLHYADVPTSYLLVMMKELTICGAIEYPDRFESGLDLLERRDLSELVTHRFALGDFDAALATLRSGDAGKVLVTMNQD